jgi:hypothetical protein
LAAEIRAPKIPCMLSMFSCKVGICVNPFGRVSQYVHEGWQLPLFCVLTYTVFAKQLEVLEASIVRDLRRLYGARCKNAAKSGGEHPNWDNVPGPMYLYIMIGYYSTTQGRKGKIRYN